MIRRKKNLQTETSVLNKDTGVFENRKVKTSKEKRSEKRKKRNWPVSVVVINVILLVVVTIECIYTSSMLNFLKNQNAYITDNTSVSLTEIATMKADIESTLKKENSLMENWKIELTDTDFSKEVYTVYIEIIPKEYTDTMETLIYFGTNEFELEKDGFVYSGYASLPIEESYNGNVTVLFVDGNKRKTEIMSDFTGVNESFEEVLSGSLSKMPVYKDNTLKFSSNCDIKLDSKKYYSFTSLDLVVEVDGEEAARYAVDKLDEENTEVADVRIAENGQTVADNLSQPELPQNDDDTNQGAGDDGTISNGTTGNDSVNNGTISNGTAGNDSVNNGTINNGIPSNGTANAESAEAEGGDTAAGIIAGGAASGNVDKVSDETGKPIKIKDMEGSYSWSDVIELNVPQNNNSARKIRVFLRAKCEEGYTFTYDLFNGATNIPEQENASAEGFQESDNYYLGNAKVKDLKGGEYIIHQEGDTE